MNDAELKNALSVLNPIEFVKVFLDFIKFGREERRRIYEDFFVPQIHLLDKSHEDYMASFKAVYESCVQMKTPNKMLVEIVRIYSLKNLTVREDAKIFSSTARAIASRFRSPAEKNAVIKFSSALNAYFKATDVADPDYKWAASWFSYVLNEVERCARMGISVWDKDHFIPVADRDLPRSFAEELKYIYERQLPARWRAVARAKDEVRSAFYVC